MDVLRGGAIGLVILWHSAGILILYDIPVPEPVIVVNSFFSPYRMPTLMFLSGLLLPASLRKPLPVYIVGKLRFIAYPLVIWTVVHYFLFQPDSTIYNFDFLTTSYLWFLVYILAYYIAAPLLTWVPTLVLVIAPLLVTPLIESDSRRRFFFLAAFFFLGKLVAEHSAVLDRVLRDRRAWIAAPIAIVFGVITAMSQPDPYQGPLAVLSIPGIVVGIKLAQWAATHSWSRSVQYVGRHSLIYYVTHFPVIILTLLLTYRVLDWPVSVVMLLGFAAAMVIGTVCAQLAATTPARWLFIAPRAGDLATFAKARRQPRAIESTER